VDWLWTGGGLAFIFSAFQNKTRILHSVDAPSFLLSLERSTRAVRIRPRFHILYINVVPAFAAGAPALRRGTHTDEYDVHRFDEVINGREYHIEVSSVGLDKWRAQIARVPGGSAALMPFYGKTPDEAARGLSRWLALAHGQAKPRV
jgi:hypothetical protein